MVHRIDRIDLFSFYVPVFSWMASCTVVVKKGGMARRCAGSGCRGGQGGGWPAGGGCGGGGVDGRGRCCGGEVLCSIICSSSPAC